MTANHEAKLLMLASGLLKSTEVNDVAWQETASEDRFCATLRHGLVEIERIEFQPNELADVQETFRLTVLDPVGRVVDSFSPADDEDRILRRLFQSARSKARNGESLLDSLLSEVGS